MKSNFSEKRPKLYLISEKKIKIINEYLLQVERSNRPKTQFEKK